MSRPHLWPWVRPFLVLSLVLSLPPIVYWFGYVQSSVQAAKTQAHTTLAAVTAELKDRIAAHDQIAGNAARYSDSPAKLRNFLSSVLRPNSIEATATAEQRLQVDAERGGLQLYVGRESRFLRASIPLENLVPWNVVETEFDGLLVVSADGRLVAQDRRLPGQPLGLPVAIERAGRRIGLGDLLSAEAQPATAPDDAAKAAPRLRSPFDFSNEPTVRVAGIDYLAVMQPVSVPVSSADPARAGGRVQLVLCGLIEQQRLRRDAIELAPQTLVLAASFVLLGLFAIPFLKLRFIGERERMQHRDVWLLAGSILFACALVTLLILDVHALEKLRTRLDTGLRAFNVAVTQHLRAETEDAVAELRAATPALREMTGTEVARSLAENCSIDLSPVAALPPRGSILATHTFERYPDFEAIFLTDACGTQIRKWMARTVPTPMISVGRESYFEPAFTATRASLPASDRDFVFSSTLAPTSGLILGVYAMALDREARSFGPDVPAAERAGLTAIAVAMRSVSNVVVAEPFQFVLVDHRGEVTFQHSRGSFRGERFFDVVTNGDALMRSATEPGNAGSYHYRGRWYRMSATHIPELRLTLVTYYEQSVVGLLAARIFLTTAVMALGIVTAILAGAALSIALFKWEATDWLWPAATRTRYYIVGSVLCLASMLVLLVARALLPADALAAFMILAPFTVMLALGSGRVIAWLRVAFERLGPRQVDGPVSPPPTSIEKMAIAYKSFAVLAMLSFVAFPTLIAFNDAYNVHAAAFGESVARQWAATSERWQERNAQQVVRLDGRLDERDCATQPDQRCSVPDRIYATAENHAHVLRARGELGLYTQCANLRDEAGCSVAAPSSAPFGASTRIAAQLAALGQGNAELQRILERFVTDQARAERAPFLYGLQPSAWAPALFALLVASLCLLVGSIARHVLGIGLASDGVLDERTQLQFKDGARWLLLRPGPQSTLQLRQRGPTLDLRLACARPEFAAPAAGDTLVVQHVEARLHDQQWREALLSLLRSQAGGCLVLVSEIDPFHYLTRRVREKGDYLRSLGKQDAAKQTEVAEVRRKLRNELADWAMALREVRKLRERPPAFSTDARVRADEQLTARIAAECTGSAALIEIGERLLARDDIATYRWDDIVGFVLDAAEPYYRSLWDLCSREERLVLIQLAQCGLANPKRMDIVRRLVRRGLIAVDPRLRLMNKSFEIFVRNVEPPERVTEWEQTGAGFSWSRLGTPLYALAAVVIAILLFTEQALFTNILAIASGTAGALGSLRGIYAAVAADKVAKVA